MVIHVDGTLQTIERIGSLQGASASLLVILMIVLLEAPESGQETVLHVPRVILAQSAVWVIQIQID